MSRARVLCTVGVALLLGGTSASAEALRSAAPRVQMPAKPGATAKPRVKADKRAKPPRAAPPAPTAPAPTTTAALLVQYQRVGRELFMLHDRLGLGYTQELWPLFRAIKLDDAQATVESREDCAATLTELQERIRRINGVRISQDCLNNPLAADCQ